MNFFEDRVEFEKNMTIIKKILDDKGLVLESDHPYAYSMQYGKAFNDVNEWLMEKRYEGELDTMGAFEKVAVYGLYDKSKVTYEKMHKELLNEARRQNMSY